MSSGAGYFCTGRMKVMEKLIVKERMKTDKPEFLSDFLQRLTGLSKIKIKDAAETGWINDASVFTCRKIKFGVSRSVEIGMSV